MQSLTTGLTAGAIVAALTFPFEALKKRLQSGEIPGQGISLMKNVLKSYSRRTIPLYGPGLGVFIGHVGPATAIQFTTDYVLKQIGLSNPNASFLQQIAQGGFCGVTGACVSTFVECVVLRQQLLSKEKGQSVGPVITLRTMIKSHGLLSPWHSFTMIASRDCTFTAFMLAIMPYGETHEIIPGVPKEVQRLVLGMGGAIISHPFDSIGTQVQKDFAKHSYSKTIQLMYQKGGIKSFYPGVSMRMVLFPFYAMALPRAITGLNQLAESIYN